MAPKYSDLEAVPQMVHGTPIETDHYAIGGGEPKNEPPSPGPNAELVTTVANSRLRRWILWLVLAVVCLVIIIVIIAAVLGARIHDITPTQTSTITIAVTMTVTATASATPTSIRQNSALGVTGWRAGSDFSIRLFYQGDDSFLRLVAFESTNEMWSSPSAFVKTKLGTPIAASSFDVGAFGDTATPSVKYPSRLWF